MSELRKPRGRGKSELNVAAAGLALRQGGHITRAQLLAIGFGRRAIEARLKAGWLFRVHQGVYAIGHLPSNPLDRARGALLLTGPRSALAGGSAAAHWGLCRRWPDPVEIISPCQHRAATVKASRCTTLLQRDIRVRFGIPVTSPARTLLDIAPHTPVRTLHRFHNELRMGA